MRDGEQSPGASMSLEEKLELAKILEEMRVDVIEAGFPIASNGDFEAVLEVSCGSRAGSARQSLVNRELGTVPNPSSFGDCPHCMRHATASPRNLTRSAASNAPDRRTLSAPSRNTMKVGIESDPVAAGKIGEHVRVDLRDEQPPAKRARDFLHFRRDDAARGAPRRPEVHQHGHARRGDEAIEHVSLGTSTGSAGALKSA